MTNDRLPNFNTVWIVVPAFNEAANISAVVASLRSSGYANVCVVDDGSEDATKAVALQAGAHVLRHPVNLGQGAALQTGITYALRQQAEFVCTFDADGQHEAGSVADLLKALAVTRADVSLGSRFLADAGTVPVLRRLLLKAGLLFTKLHAGLSLTDTHNGLRIFTRHAANSITIEQAAMAHASEILYKIRVQRLRFVEVPVTIRYTAASMRKGQSASDAVRIILDLVYHSLALRP